MDLDDLVDLTSVVVDEIEKAISSGDKKVAGLLWLGEMDNCFVEDLTSGSVVEDN